MKILHTADWHIGKKLHKQELSQDFDLFIKWLCEILELQKVDILLVSGDIFDLANPSSEARSQYFRALLKLKKYNCKIILTGGNHDSPAMLDAPKEILKELDIHIIGGLPENLEDVLIPVQDKTGNVELVLAAVPFLRDSDLRKISDGESYEDRLEAVTKGIKKIFSEVSSFCEKKFPKVPAVAMGHLFAAGIKTSESERDIQIGNQAAFDATHFGNYFNYVALGHIHKPQQVSAEIPIFYSGSPLPLSFSERKDEKRVLLIDSEKGWNPQSIPVPSFRKLIRLKGDLEHLRKKLNTLDAPGKLESLLEVELFEENFDAEKIRQLDDLVSNFEMPGFRIVKHRATFKNALKKTSELFDGSTQLQDLKPKEVFLQLLDQQELDPQSRQSVLEAFEELLSEIDQDEKIMTAAL